MNSWQLIGQQNLRSDPARCDENVLLVHNVGTSLCINPPIHMQKNTQKIHKKYTKNTQKILLICTLKAVLLIRSKRTTTKNLNSTCAPRWLEPKRMYRLHAQTNVKKTTRVVQICPSPQMRFTHRSPLATSMRPLRSSQKTPLAKDYRGAA